MYSADQLSSHFFTDLLDSVIVDVASECHRIARLGLDRNLEEEEEELGISAEARANVADPSNSGESKCQGRMARVFRLQEAAPLLRIAVHEVALLSPHSNSTTMHRLSNGTPGVAGDEYSNGITEH